MTKQKNPTSFYRRGTNNPNFGYYAEGNYAIVKPLTQGYYGFLNGVNSSNTTQTTRQIKTKVKNINHLSFTHLTV